MNQEYWNECCVTTRVAPLRHRAVSRMDPAERLIVTGIVGGLHRHDDNSWFVPSFSSGHIVVTPCVDVSPTCACAISCSLRHTTGMMINASFMMSGQNSEMEDAMLEPPLMVSDGRCLNGFQQ